MGELQVNDIYLITEYTEAMVNGELKMSVHQRKYATNEDLIKLAWYYWENSDVIEEIDLNDLQNAIEFVERVDVVEKLKVTIEGVYSPAHDITTIFQYIDNLKGSSIRQEVIGWYFGEPTDALNKEYGNKVVWDLYDIK